MSREIVDAMRALAREKGIPEERLVAALEDALLSAYKKQPDSAKYARVELDSDSGEYRVIELLVPEMLEAGLIVETIDEQSYEDPETGEWIEPTEIEIPGEKLAEHRDEIPEQDVTPDDFGRIAAQTAKQVILQRTRDAERENVYNEYKDRKGEIVTGIARRFERGNIVVDLGRAEAVLTVREQVPRETYRAGDRVQAYVLDVLRESKGPQIILSRASVNLLTKLFEMEVPEIAEGIVVIEAAAREPGGRAKIAVSSRDSDVDPVGACVGMKGSRVQAVVQELRGEKIDIVPYDDDFARFVCNALAPAEVSRVIIDEQNRAMELIVPDDQLSLAIGRRGQNVRLAAQLTGWKLDINSETRVGELREFASRSLGALPGVNEMLIETLYAHGFRQAKDIAEANPEVLVQVPGVDPEQVVAMQEKARSQMIDDQIELARLDQEREAARQAEARRHPDELTQAERLARVRGLGERAIESLLLAGYKTVEDVANEKDIARLGDVPGVGIKKARQIKSAAEGYLLEEARLRAELNAQRASDAPLQTTEAPSAPEV